MTEVTTGLCSGQAKATTAGSLAQVLAQCLIGLQLRAEFLDLLLLSRRGALAFGDLAHCPAAHTDAEVP